MLKCKTVLECLAKLVAAIMLTALGCTIVKHAEAAEIEAFVLGQHQSDILRGPPFYMNDPRYDPTNDYIAIGVTIEFHRVELDLSQGLKTIDCGYFTTHKSCRWESGTQLSVKYYPWRKR